jgi:phenylpropionate dioxygenase-like ring-hydroxylating dioxygenase large terminal subunit
MTPPSARWWPVATSQQVRKGKALSCSLLDTPLALFRNAHGEVAALVDRCPHRHAPLSAGCVRQGELQCPYHGWRFDHQGRCTAVPGKPSHSTSATALARVVATMEMCGLVWACLHPQTDTPAPTLPSGYPDDADVFFMTEQVHCTIADAAENFLDGFHTHFVHAGWIRRDTQRQSVTVHVRRIADGVEAIYTNEGLQSGLISRLLERKRQESVGRFRTPAVAEIEYRSPQGRSLCITAWFTPETSTRLRVHARIATAPGWWPAWLKAWVLRRLFSVILRQDKTILEITSANKARFMATDGPAAQPAPLDSPLDLLGPHIRSLLAGEALQGLDTPTTITVHL